MKWYMTCILFHFSSYSFIVITTKYTTITIILSLIKKYICTSISLYSTQCSRPYSVVSDADHYLKYLSPLLLLLFLLSILLLLLQIQTTFSRKEQDLLKREQSYKVQCNMPANVVSPTVMCTCTGMYTCTVMCTCTVVCTCTLMCTCTVILVYLSVTLANFDVPLEKYSIIAVNPWRTI